MKYWWVLAWEPATCTVNFMTWLHTEQTVQESSIKITSPLLTLQSPDLCWSRKTPAPCSQTRFLHSAHRHRVLVSVSLCFKQTIAPSPDQRGVTLAASCFLMNLHKGTSAKQAALRLSAFTSQHQGTGHSSDQGSSAVQYIPSAIKVNESYMTCRRHLSPAWDTLARLTYNKHLHWDTAAFRDN